MANTVNLGVLELIEGVAAGEITANEALELIDSMVQPRAIAFQNAPPGSPANGDRYVVGTAGSGAWVGNNNKIVVYLSGTWKFITPQAGWLVWDIANAVARRYDGAAWSAAPAAINALTDNTGGAATDTLAAITAGAGYAQADMVAVKNGLASIAAKVNALRTAAKNTNGLP